MRLARACGYGGPWGALARSRCHGALIGQQLVA
jgi:hypothetical protein